jgi:hypothetical protein
VLVLLKTGIAGGAFAQFSPPLDPAQFDQQMFEFVGQVKNFPPAGVRLPATSIQYGYISHVNGLSDSKIYLTGLPQDETSALLTFYKTR